MTTISFKKLKLQYRYSAARFLAARIPLYQLSASQLLYNFVAEEDRFVFEMEIVSRTFASFISLCLWKQSFCSGTDIGCNTTDGLEQLE